MGPDYLRNWGFATYLHHPTPLSTMALLNISTRLHRRCVVTHINLSFLLTSSTPLVDIPFYVFSMITIFSFSSSTSYGPTNPLVKLNPSEYLTEWIPLKDTTVYNKLKADNWEEWEQNTLNQMQRSYLLDSRLEAKYCEEALLMVVHIYNQLPPSTNGIADSPIKLCNGANGSLNYVRIFGCKAYVRIPECRKGSTWGLLEFRGKTLENSYILVDLMHLVTVRFGWDNRYFFEEASKMLANLFEYQFEQVKMSSLHLAQHRAASCLVSGSQGPSSPC